MKECNICLEKKEKTKNCFYKCSLKICHNCIIQIIKVGSQVTYMCPQCRRTKILIGQRGYQSSFCIKNTDITDGIIRKYMYKYNFEKTNSSEDEITYRI